MKQEIKDRIDKIKNGEVPEGYRDSYIGIIPEEWSLKEISEISDVKGGKRIPKGYSLTENNTGFPYITVSDMRNGSIDINNIKYVPLEVIDQIKNYRIYQDDLFISVAGTLGIVGKIPKQLNGANLTENADKITNIRINKEYLYHVLTSSIIQKKIDNEKTTNAQPKLALERIRKFLIPLSSEFETAKIASILSTWDKVIELKEKLIEEKKKQKKGLMQKLLTGEVRLSGFDGEWKEVELRKIVDEFIVPMRDKPKKFDGDIPWCRIEDFDSKYLFDSKSGQRVSYETIDWMNLRVYPIDTLLVSCSANLGECAIVKKPLITNQTFIGLVTNEKIEVELLYYVMIFNKEKLNNLSSGTTISYLSRNEFEKFKIIIPIDKNEQKVISSILDTSDKEISLLEQELEALKLQKKGLMQLLLTGIVRVNTEN